MRQCSLDSHHTQKAWFGSLAKLSGPKSEFQSNRVHCRMLNAWLALCLSFTEFNKSHKAFRSVLPFPTSSATVILWFTAWIRSPNTSQKGWRAAFPAHSQFLTSPGDSVAHESGRRLGGFFTLVIHSAPGNISKVFPGCAPSSLEQRGCRKLFQPSDVKQFCSGRKIPSPSHLQPSLRKFTLGIVLLCLAKRNSLIKKKILKMSFTEILLVSDTSLMILFYLTIVRLSSSETR